MNSDYLNENPEVADREIAPHIIVGRHLNVWQREEDAIVTSAEHYSETTMHTIGVVQLTVVETDADRIAAAAIDKLTADLLAVNYGQL